MSLMIVGKIEKQGFGFGTWALVTDTGQIYELKDPPAELRQALNRVRVEGKIRDDVMTLAAIGPVLEIESFEILK